MPINRRTITCNCSPSGFLHLDIRSLVAPLALYRYPQACRIRRTSNLSSELGPTKFGCRRESVRPGPHLPRCTNHQQLASINYDTHSVPGSSTAVSRRAHKTDATTELPYEVKAAIVSHLNGQDTKQVSLVNRAWKAATVDHLWARVRIPPVIDHDQWGKTCTPGLKEAESWKLFRQLLERNPARVSAIREMTVLLAPKAMEDRLAILKLVSPYIT